MVLSKSHKLHGLTMCAIIVVNMIFKLLSHLSTSHIRSLSRAVNEDQGGFQYLAKKGTY